MFLLRSSRYTTYAIVEDINELFSVPWVSRLWTYQEFLLSSSPMFVCGPRSIHWIQMARAMLFLRQAMDHVQSCHSRWLDMMISKEMLDASDENHTESTRLQVYWNFTQKFRFVYRILKLKWFVWVGLFALIWIEPLFTFSKTTEMTSYLKHIFWIGFGGFSVVYFIVRVACCWRRWDIQVWKLGDNLLSELSRRKATDPKDMAYGAWAVLERKGGSMTIPAPSLDTGDIYRAFTQYFLETTTSLDVLLLAAAQNYAGQPSWVPNIAGHVSHHWWPAIEEQVKGKGNWLKPMKPRQKVGADRHFQLLQDGKTLRVHASCMPLISCLYVFKPTDDVYDASQRDLHLDNLETLITLGFQYVRNHWNDINDKTHAIDASAESISEWAAFMQRNLKSSRITTRKLLRWIQRHDSKFQLLGRLHRVKGRNLMETHIRICNWLSLQKTTGFSTSMGSVVLGGEPMYTIHNLQGRCSSDVQVGDEIFKLTEGGQMLIVRRMPGLDPENVKIVSLMEYREYRDVRDPGSTRIPTFPQEWYIIH